MATADSTGSGEVNTLLQRNGGPTETPGSSDQNAETTCATCKNLPFLNIEETSGSFSRLGEEFERLQYRPMNPSPNSRTAVPLPYGGWAFSFEEGGKLPYPLLSEWLRTAGGGCRYCRLVISTIPFCHRWKSSDKYVATRVVESYPLEVCLINAKKKLQHEREQYVDIFAMGDLSRWPMLGYSGFVCERNCGDDAVNKMQRWLKDCEANHAICRMRAPKFMPTRVLDLALVEFSGKVFLVENADIAPFVALSYCWGIRRRRWLVTTTANVEEHQRHGIPINRLQPSLRDAVHITQRLGIRFLWIDSICIIQDDKKDWCREAAEMGNVYFNSHLVISSNWSPDSSIPFLGTQVSGSPLWQYRLRVPFLQAHEQIYVRKSAVHDHRFRALFQEPRNSRGWCFQESLFARRELRFTGHEMMWSCAESEKCECQEVRQLEAVGATSTKALMRTASRMFYATQMSADERLSAEELLVAWYVMVSDYSQRRLTFLEDRLKALKSGARVVRKALIESRSHNEPSPNDQSPNDQRHSNQAPKETYLAGLWKSDLARGILWYSAFQKSTMAEVADINRSVHFIWASRFGQKFFWALKEMVLDCWDIITSALESCFNSLYCFSPGKPAKAMSRAESESIPSWSWASAISPVAWPLGIGDCSIQEEKFTSQVDIQPAEPETLTSNESGPVLSARLKLDGEMVEVRLKNIRALSTNRSFPCPSDFFPARGPAKVISVVRGEDGVTAKCILDSRNEVDPVFDGGGADCLLDAARTICDKTDCGCRNGWSSRPYWCIKTGTTSRKTLDGQVIQAVLFLVLKSGTEKQVYERVGVGSTGVDQTSLFYQSQKAKIILA